MTAVIVVVPPSAGTSVGFALTITRPTAAVPTRIFNALAEATDAPPEIAVIVAVPEPVPARNFTIARPLMSVSACDGSIDPSVVVNETVVPCCGGVPDGSMTWAIRLVDPLTGRAVAEAISVIVDPLGARSGTR